MAPRTSNEVRDSFLQYYATKANHDIWPSSPVVPHDDPTLLFINAGMNQFKPVFLGEADPSSKMGLAKRVCNSQKCIRAGGKHNDLDDVGKDVYHHTFFEMLGNWSFGDFFKKEAIAWSWALLTEEWGIEKDRLYVTYFGGDPSLPDCPPDEEARQLWAQFLPVDRILPFGTKDNFWEMGATGPCGPCSEIHYDRVGNREAHSLVNMDDPSVLEVWNLVFMQFNRKPDGCLVPLPNKHIDTGMGLERVTSILQGKDSNYDTDAFTPIFEAVKVLAPNAPAYGGKIGDEDPHKIDMAYRVIADHLRTLTIAMSDDVWPSNAGRGYVLRRILRRAVRYGRQFLEMPRDSPWFSKLVPVVVEILGDAFPEMKKNPKKIESVLSDEEIQFGKTLDKGVNLFNRSAAKLEKEGVKSFPGELAFDLYATFGFPIDLTQLMCQERQLEVDVTKFDEAFNEHRQASENKSFSASAALTMSADRIHQLESDWGVSSANDGEKYDWEADTGIGSGFSSTVKAIWDGKEFLKEVSGVSQGKVVGVFLHNTKFYAEGGGQPGDTGFLTIKRGDGPVEIMVLDCQKTGSKGVMHVVIVMDDGMLQVGSQLTGCVDYARRAKLAKNHTGTHLLNFVLRKMLGPETDQKGSGFDDERFKFDYATTRAGLTVDEVILLEAEVEKLIEKNMTVHKEMVPLDDVGVPIRCSFHQNDALPSTKGRFHLKWQLHSYVTYLLHLG
eukprot:GHVN01034869.1.p1 GENE.GHVN01034869.1~~GHVN01034869.1.p1  ORF type:complete len:780 (-),score=180.31 GHVN01034869.1:3834-6005(-)